MAKPRKSYFWWIFGKVLYGLLGLGIFVMVLFLLWRVYFSGALPDEMKRLSPNGKIAAVYLEKGELLLQTQEQSTHTRGENNYGYFAVPRFVFIPEADQVQVVFRYNNSTLEATQKDFELDALPPRGEEIFDLVVTQYINTTPDKTGEERVIESRTVTPTSCEIGTTSLYTFCRYTFDGVDLENNVVVYLDIYYGEAESSYSTLRLYHEESVSEWRNLTHKEKKEIEG